MKIEPDHLIALLIAAPSSWLAGLSQTTRSVVLIGSVAVAVLVSGFGAGVWWVTAQSEWGSHPARITALEVRADSLVEWREIHELETSEPGLARITALEVRADSLETTWREDMQLVREMTFQLYCREFPGRCEAQPAPDRED